VSASFGADETVPASAGRGEFVEHEAIRELIDIRRPN